MPLASFGVQPFARRLIIALVGGREDGWQMSRPILLIFLVLLTSCGEREVDIGDGYKYVQLDGRNWTIADQEHHIVVDPNVKRCKVIGRFIVGERDDANIDERNSKKYGLFIFDKQTKMLIEGLDRNAFETALRARGLPENPL